MNENNGFLVMESGEVYAGQWSGGRDRAGEVVFNTSHSGYEEMATDPSYFGQILVLTAPQQGNYGEDDGWWESSKIWIEGFICVEMQSSERESSWRNKLDRFGVPILADVNTRKLVLQLREKGTQWGALVKAETAEAAAAKAPKLIADKKSMERDWVHVVSCKTAETRKGKNPRGPKVAVLDLGCKENSLRELVNR